MSAGRILDVSTDGLHLSAMRGFMVAEKDKTEVLRAPLDQLDAVIVHAHGVTYSNSLLNRLLDQKCAVVICGSNHAPRGFIWGVEGHHRQAARTDLQIERTPRLKRRLWKQIVQCKIRMQAANLSHFEKPHAAGLRAMAGKVKAGDPDNLEAQAARRYWPALFGPGFSRDQGADGVNAQLNYGYTVLRALVARQVYASGLMPVIGLHHRNKNNSMRLVDDLMEPLRPVVDRMVVGLLSAGIDDVSPDAKRVLGTLGHESVVSEKGATDLAWAVEYMLNSLIAVFETGKGNLCFPDFGYALTA